MKEAAGEANLTVVAIILIAVVVAVATPLVTSLMSNSTYRSCCSDAGLVWKGGKCQYPNNMPEADKTAANTEYVNCQKDAGKDTTKEVESTAGSSSGSKKKK